MERTEDWREYTTETIKKSDIDTIGEDRADRSTAKIMVEINEVCSFYENTTGEQECLTLLLKSGDSVIILYSYEDFKILRTGQA